MNRTSFLLAAACLVLAACSKPSDTPNAEAGAQPPAGAANAPQVTRPEAPKDLPVGAQVPGQAPTMVKLSDGTMVDLATLKPMPGAKPVENPVVLKAPAPETTRSLGEPEAPAPRDKASKAEKAERGAAGAASRSNAASAPAEKR